MSAPSWRYENLNAIGLPDWDWSLPDGETDRRLQHSLERHGQLQPVVVRRVGDSLEVVAGRGILAALRARGETRGWVVDLGHIDRLAAMAVDLGLRVRARTDFVALAAGVAEIAAADPDATRWLAGLSPFSEARLKYFVQLATFDWRSLSEAAAQGQHGFDWDETAAASPGLDLAPDLVESPTTHAAAPFDPPLDLRALGDAELVTGSAPSLETAVEPDPVPDVPNLLAPVPPAPDADEFQQSLF